MLEPVYRDYEARIQRCVSGLTQYAAGLAATGEEARLPELRQLIVEMAGFWNLEHYESKDAFQNQRAKDGDAFDRAVAEAKVSGRTPALSREVQEDVFSGLELYAKEMTDSGGMERWVLQCETLAEQLQEEWTEQEPRMGGITLE